MPGIEPGASRMLSARSTTELHPLACTLMVKVLCLVSAILFKKKKHYETSKLHDVSSGWPSGLRRQI